MTSRFLPCLVALSCICLAVAQTSYQNISLGWSLIASVDSSSLLSPSGDFAFGFHRLENQDFYLLSIWFDKIPNKTLVWYANGDNPAPQGSKVELNRDDALVLKDPQGSVIWKPSVIPSGFAYAAMLDTGNFILADNHSSPLWQSFDDPADTLLPTQILGINKSVSSRTTENNFTRGRFELRLIPDGNLVLNTIALPTGNALEAYYHSNTVDATDGRITGNRLIFNESGYLYIVKTDGEIVNVTSVNIVPTGDLYYRATIDYDGVFRQYGHRKTPRDGSWDETWFTLWSAPSDICVEMQGERGGGTCGFNSYCTLDADGRPNCECLPGFQFSDSGNKLNGCEQDAIQKCNLGDSRPEDVYYMQKLNNIYWPNSSNYEELSSFSDGQCMESCLYDCLCVVAVSNDGTCYKKKHPVSNGRRFQNRNGKAYVKRLISNIPSVDSDKRSGLGRKSQETLSLIALSLLGCSAFLNFVLLVALLLIVLKIYGPRPKLKKSPSLLDTNLRTYTYENLKEATDNFREELGRGAFGTVYKGTLIFSGSRNTVAIKKLDKIAQEGEREFKTEVSIIAKTHHKNLVRLLGFCNELSHKLLVYEFMSNGSLANFLFEGSRPEWSKRIQFALGIARGLMYLHEECSKQIIHCDIKPQNILLDDTFTARISDFGLAKLLMNDQSKTLTAIRGTKGYVAPEWFRSNPVTAKVDVYSYGVMLLEIICCRKCIDMEKENVEEAILVDWAYDCYIKKKLYKLIEDDEEAISNLRQVEKLAMVAIWCIQEDHNVRPSMKMVLHMLEGVVQVPAPPSPYSNSSVF